MNINNDYTNLFVNKDKMSNVEKRRLKDASEGLEAEFIKIFLKQSKKIIFKNDEKQSKAPGKDIMTDFMLERFAEQMSKTSPIGLSKMIIQNVEKNDISKEEVNKSLENYNNIKASDEI